MLCRLTYALGDDGRVIHISQAERGAGCGCRCPGCGGALIARRGAETEHHFAHADGVECPDGYVNSLYLAFRMAAQELRTITLPPYEKNRALVENGSGLHVLLPQARVRIDRIELVRKGSTRIAGLLLYRGGRPLMLRLLTSYSEGSRDIARLKAAEMSVLEIDLTRDDAIDPQTAQAYLTKPPANVCWLYNAKAEKTWEAMLGQCVRRKVVKEDNRQLTYGCPIPSKRCDGIRCFILDSCAHCRFFFGMAGVGEESCVLCGRDRLIAEPEDIGLTMAQRKEKYGVRW